MEVRHSVDLQERVEMLKNDGSKCIVKQGSRAWTGDITRYGTCTCRLVIKSKNDHNTPQIYFESSVMFSDILNC